ncbi:MAG: SurA N-terminal domain-containing protein, partial [Deltaproteobacteria bacterium]|nr:SurA N-terminal domain-containing protein [Deltaproteobacteria bacterium]
MLLVKRIQNFKWAVLFSILFLLSFAKPVLTQEAEIPEVVDRIVAKVNDEIILLSELNEALESYTGKVNNYSSSDERRQEMIFKLREDVLNQLVEKKLSEQQIKELGIRIEDGEIDNAIERIKESNFFTDETLRKMLA